jgi:hypothetical protein
LIARHYHGLHSGGEGGAGGVGGVTGGAGGGGEAPKMHYRIDNVGNFIVNDQYVVIPILSKCSFSNSDGDSQETECECLQMDRSLFQNHI